MGELQNKIAWDCAAPFIINKRVGGDVIDGLQHVNNAAYVSWCEDAAWQHSISLGLGLEQYHDLDRAMAIRHSEYDYQLAAYEDDELLIGTWLVDSGSKLTMKRLFQVVREGDGVTVMRGAWQLVCIQISTGRPKRLPKEFMESYGGVVVAQS